MLADGNLRIEDYLAAVQDSANGMNSESKNSKMKCYVNNSEAGGFLGILYNFILL